ncbi:MAG: hypothetical protein ACLR7Z_21455 [Bilophila wadsworthia]
MECRTWRCSYRGPLLICSSKGITRSTTGSRPRRMGLGVVELVDVRPMTEADACGHAVRRRWRTRSKALHGMSNRSTRSSLPGEGQAQLFEVDDDLLKRLPDGYEDHCDYMYQQGLRWKDEDDPLTLEEFLEQQGLV